MLVTKTAILSLILSSFHPNALPGFSTPVYDDRCSFDECEYIKEVFCDKKWVDVAEGYTSLHGEIFPFFSEEALLYFLPSFVIMVIENYDEMDVFRDQFLRELAQEDTSSDEIVYRKLIGSSLISQEQRKAIAAFLKYIYQTYDDKDAYRALNTGWNEYLP